MSHLTALSYHISQRSKFRNEFPFLELSIREPLQVCCTRLTLESYGQRSHGRSFISNQWSSGQIWKTRRKKEKCRTERLKEAHFTSVWFDNGKPLLQSWGRLYRMAGHSSLYMTGFLSTCGLSHFLFKEDMEVEQPSEFRKTHLCRPKLQCLCEWGIQHWVREGLCSVSLEHLSCPVQSE